MPSAQPCGGLFVGNDLGGNVFGQFEMNRPRPLGLCDAEGIRDDRGNSLRIDDLFGHFGNGFHRRHDIDNLEPSLTAVAGRFLAGDHDHRKRAEVGIGGCRHEICRTGSKRRETYAGFAGQPAVGCRHEAGCLFVTVDDDADVRSAKRIQQVEVLFPRNSENDFDALVLQCPDKQVRGLELCGL